MPENFNHETNEQLGSYAVIRVADLPYSIHSTESIEEILVQIETAKEKNHLFIYVVGIDNSVECIPYRYIRHMFWSTPETRLRVQRRQDLLNQTFPDDDESSEPWM